MTQPRPFPRWWFTARGKRNGLLPVVTRTVAGYRRYSPTTIQRVMLIQRALVVGFSLADLKRVLGVRDNGGAPCRSVRALVGERLDELNRRIEELIGLREELRSLLDEWDTKLATTPKGQRALLLETLGSRPATTVSAARRNEPSITCVYTLSVVSIFACPISCAMNLAGTPFSCAHDE